MTQQNLGKNKNCDLIFLYKKKKGNKKRLEKSENDGNEDMNDNLDNKYETNEKYY